MQVSAEYLLGIKVPQSLVLRTLLLWAMCLLLPFNKEIPGWGRLGVATGFFALMGVGYWTSHQVIMIVGAPLLTALGASIGMAILWNWPKR